MGRVYVVSFEDVTVAQDQDLFLINGAAGMILEIVGFNIDCVDVTAPTDQQLKLSGRFLPATVTAGTGGSAPTPRKLDNGDPAATFTARANDITTQATSSGTAVNRWEGGCNVKAGIQHFFPYKPIVGPSQAFALTLLADPATSLKLSGSITVMEKGG